MNIFFKTGKILFQILAIILILIALTIEHLSKTKKLHKTNKIGKWVYQGTTNEFTVGTVVSGDLTVVAAYEQNIFTVKFMVDSAQYEEMTTSKGQKIILPSDPIKEGCTFSGWFTASGGQFDIRNPRH